MSLIMPISRMNISAIGLIRVISSQTSFQSLQVQVGIDRIQRSINPPSLNIALADQKQNYGK